MTMMAEGFGRAFVFAPVVRPDADAATVVAAVVHGSSLPVCFQIHCVLWLLL
jgi:hypothetical protein